MRELRGLPVVDALAEKFKVQIEESVKSNIVPKLAVVRVGERGDDLAYEKGIIKRFSAVGADAEIFSAPLDISQHALEQMIMDLNGDERAHGIIVFRPLPGHLSEARLKTIIDDKKDVDCMGITNTAYVFEGHKTGYAPCTPQAVIEILDYYGIGLAGKKVTIIGRSLVVGKPLAMLLLDRNATVTICHTKTLNLAEECKKADILIPCAGAAKMVGPDFTHGEQIIIDVGINYAGGKLCGDVDYEAVANKVAAITPVPGGVGTVTTSVLLKHTIQSAENKIAR